MLKRLGFIAIITIFIAALTIQVPTIAAEENSTLIPDEGLRKLINKELGQDENYEPTAEDLKEITELKITYSYIETLQGLEYAVNLKDLSISGVYFEDLKPLRDLKNIETLYIGMNHIDDLTPLENMTNLRELSLFQNHVEDLTPLRNLTNLEFLQLDHNFIEDLSGLENLNSLTTLLIAVNGVTDLTPLENLTNLKELDLGGNKITDITPLKNLTNLTKLDLVENNITKLNGLEKLTNLKEISLHFNEINDLSALKNLNNLEEVFLGNNEIKDITSLKNLTRLESLSLNNNKIKDIIALKNLTNLTELSLSSNNISNIKSLKHLKNLENLNIENNKISDLTAINNLQKLEYINLENNRVNDLSPLNRLSNLNLIFPDNQTIILPKKSLTKKDKSLAIKNPVIDFDGSTVKPHSISNNGKYSKSNIIWENMNDSVSEVTFEFDNGGNRYWDFSGKVIQPIEWVKESESGYKNNPDTNDKVDKPKQEKIIVTPGKTISIKAKDEIVIEKTETTIEMPSNLPEGTKVSAESVTESKLANLNGMTLAGDAIAVTLEFPKSKETFTGTYVLTMPYDNKAYSIEQVDIYYFNEITNTWVKQNGTINEKQGTITVNVLHFSTYAVLAEDVKAESDVNENIIETTTSNNNDNNTEGKILPKTATNSFNWLLVGALLLVIGIATTMLPKRKTVK